MNAINTHLLKTRAVLTVIKANKLVLPWFISNQADGGLCALRKIKVIKNVHFPRNET